MTVTNFTKEIDNWKLSSESKEYLIKLVKNFEKACEVSGGTPKAVIPIYWLNPRLHLFCENLPSDEAIAAVYNTLKSLHLPDGMDEILSVIAGDEQRKKVKVSVSKNEPIHVEIEEMIPIPTKFADGYSKSIEEENKSLYVSCKEEVCEVSYDINGIPDYMQVMDVIKSKFDEALAPFIEFGDIFSKECENNGGKLEGVICKVSTLDAADRLYRILSRFGEEVPLYGWRSDVNAGISYNNGGSFNLICSVNDRCEFYGKYKESVDIPEILGSDVLAPFIRHTKFTDCDVEDNEVSCKWSGHTAMHVWESLKPSEVISKLREEVIELVDVLARSAEDIKRGNVWVQTELRDVCGIPFPIYQKDDEELALGFGTTSGGYAFQRVEEIPDAMMKELYNKGYAEDIDELDELEEECKEMEEEGVL